MTVSAITLSNGTASRRVTYAEIVARGKDPRNEPVQPEDPPGFYVNAGDPIAGRFPLELGLVPADFVPDRVTIEDVDGGTYTAHAPQSHTVIIPAAADATVREAHPDASYGADPLSVTAVLRLEVASDGGNDDGPRLYRTATTGWTESVTWRTRPSTTGGALADLGAVGNGAIVNLPVTSVVTGDGTYGFVLVGDSTDQWVAASRESPGGPALVVTYRL